MDLSRLTACSAVVHLHRPDRGPEHRCDRPARYLVRAPLAHGAFVCGHHARAWLPEVLVPVHRA